MLHVQISEGAVSHVSKFNEIGDLRRPLLSGSLSHPASIRGGGLAHIERFPEAGLLDPLRPIGRANAPAAVVSARPPQLLSIVLLNPIAPSSTCTQHVLVVHRDSHCRFTNHV